jgi:plastocyanin
MKKILIILPILLIAVILLSGCTSSYVDSNAAPPTSPGDNGPPLPPEHVVNIKDFAFSPQTITIKKGSSVTWVNQDSTSHIVASNPHPAHTDLPGLVSSQLSQGQTYTFTFTKTGTFGYHCHLHPTMTGTVIVEE